MFKVSNTGPLRIARAHFARLVRLQPQVQPEVAETSLFLEEAAVFQNALSDVNQSLPLSEQDSLIALEERAFTNGLAAWEGVTGRGASDLTVFNRLEFLRIQKRCQAALTTV